MHEHVAPCGPAPPALAQALLSAPTAVLRIDVSRDGRGRVIKVAGRLDAAGLHHLLAVCVPRPTNLRLDLSELRSVDEEGCRSLQALRAAGAEIVGEAMFIRARLNDGAARQEALDALGNQD